MGRARSTTPQRPRSSTSQRSEFSCLAPRAGSTTTGDHDQAQAAAGGILNVTPDTRAATVLHTADEVPEHLREPFISCSAGYRVNLTWSQCLLSLFRWHNQTLNIWTHLPFTIVCVILCLRLSSHVDVLSNVLSNVLSTCCRRDRRTLHGQRRAWRLRIAEMRSKREFLCGHLVSMQ